jgi:alpha-tubulin suppressor-like RCC1 family protein
MFAYSNYYSSMYVYVYVGSGQNGKLGQGKEESLASPMVIKALAHLNITYISAGCEHSAAITDEGVVYM